MPYILREHLLWLTQSQKLVCLEPGNTCFDVGAVGIGLRVRSSSLLSEESEGNGICDLPLSILLNRPERKNHPTKTIESWLNQSWATYVNVNTSKLACKSFGVLAGDKYCTSKGEISIVGVLVCSNSASSGFNIDNLERYLQGHDINEEDVLRQLEPSNKQCQWLV